MYNSKMRSRLTHRQRSTITSLHTLGQSLGQIAKTLSIPRATVQNVVNNYKETGRSPTKPAKRNRTVRTNRMVRRVSGILAKDPKRSIRRLAKELKMARGTLQRLLREARACSKPHKTFDSLKSALKREWNKLDQKIIFRSCMSVKRRLQRVIDAEGDYIE